MFVVYAANELVKGLTAVVSFFLFFLSEFRVFDAVLMMLRRHGVLASTMFSTFSFKFQDMRYSGVIMLVMVWNSNVSTSISSYMVLRTCCSAYGLIHLSSTILPLVWSIIMSRMFSSLCLLCASYIFWQ